MSPLNESFINYLKTSHIEKELNEWIFLLAVQKGKKVYANISICIFEPMRFTQTGGRIELDELLSKPET